MNHMPVLWPDLRYSVRQLARSPVATAAAIISLTLGAAILADPRYASDQAMIGKTIRVENRPLRIVGGSPGPCASS